MLRLPKGIARQIVDHAGEQAPDECCGILAGKKGVASRVYRITNTVKSPYRYLMDPQEFLDADKDVESKQIEFLAFYHSHTHSEAYPSSTDVRMALESGWLDVFYVLVSTSDETHSAIRAFSIDPSGQIVEGEL